MLWNESTIILAIVGMVGLFATATVYQRSIGALISFLCGLNASAILIFIGIGMLVSII